MTARKPAPTPDQACVSIDAAIQLLKGARRNLTFAACRQTLRKVRSAIKSAEGALRNAESRRGRLE